MKIERRFTRAGRGPLRGPRLRAARFGDPQSRRESDLPPGERDRSIRLVADRDRHPRAEILPQAGRAARPRRGRPRRRQTPEGKPATGGETDARQVFHRLAHTWTEWGRRNGYFTTSDDAQAFYDELCAMLARQMGAPNSPQWFNTGLFAVYGLTGPAQGHYFVNPKTNGEVERPPAPTSARSRTRASPSTRRCPRPRSGVHRLHRGGRSRRDGSVRRHRRRARHHPRCRRHGKRRQAGLPRRAEERRDPRGDRRSPRARLASGAARPWVRVDELAPACSCACPRPPNVHDRT